MISGSPYGQVPYASIAVRIPPFEPVVPVNFVTPTGIIYYDESVTIRHEFGSTNIFSQQDKGGISGS